MIVGETTYSAAGGAGGKNSISNNGDGGAYGGGQPGTSLAISGNGEDGPYLFNDSTLKKVGSGGGGAYIGYSSDDESFNHRYGNAGADGGTRGLSYDLRATSSYISTDDATVGGGSGAIVIATSSSYSISRWAGAGGDGFVAFRKAV